MFDARRHFRANGSIHLMWIIVILVLSCAALITYRPDAEKVTSFFGFAATLTSLFLGAIAIFYAMIANQGFSSTLGSLQRSSENVEAAARNISSTSGALTGQSDRLIAELTQLSPAVLGISEKIDRLSPSSVAETEEALSGTWLVKNPNNGSVVCLYAMARACTERKQLVATLVFPNKLIWQQYLLAFLDALCMVPTKGLKVERHEGAFGLDRPYTVISLGPLSADEIIKAANAATSDPITNMKALIDAYFGSAH